MLEREIYPLFSALPAHISGRALRIFHDHFTSTTFVFLGDVFTDSTHSPRYLGTRNFPCFRAEKNLLSSLTPSIMTQVFVSASKSFTSSFFLSTSFSLLHCWYLHWNNDANSIR